METPFFDDAAPGPSGIDVLSDILRVFHGTGAALLRGEFGALGLACAALERDR
jgi:hypothetical protein